MPEIMSEVDATATKTSANFRIPKRFKRIYVYVDVIDGSTLLLDATLNVFLDKANDGAGIWKTVVTDLPSAGGITGVSTTVFAFVEVSVADIDAGITDKRVSFRGELQLVITHGNATECTYKAFWQPA